jgi:type IV fimbrial biogenesis protein FimT
VLTPHRSAGFSLVELLIAVSIMAVMAALALPSLSSWVQSARMRAVADALQAGLHVAQTEAQRRSNTVVLFMTGSTACDTNASAATNGAYWQARLVPDLLQSIPAEAVQCGALADVAAGVTITASSTAVCFGADGRLATATGPAGLAVDCAASSASYLIQRSGSERRLRLTVSMAGAIRMCDPDKASTAPDGCR